MSLHGVDSFLRVANLAVTAGANLLVQSTLLIGAGLLVARICRFRGAALRSAVLRASVVALLLCPVATLLLSAVGITGITLGLPQAALLAAAEAAEAPQPPVTEPEPEPLLIMNEPQPAADMSYGSYRSYSPYAPNPAAAPLPAASLPEPVVPAPEPATGNALAILYSALILAWVAGSTVLLARLTLAHIRMAWIRWSAPCAPDALVGACAHFAGTMKVRAPLMLMSRQVHSPCLTGLLRPAILLPADSDDSAEAQHEVIVHELAHLLRCDCAWNLLCRAVRAVLWFQPLVWTLTHRVEEVSDDVADDYVVRHGLDRKQYVRRLVDIATRFQPAPAEMAAGVGVVAFRSSLGRRVQRILDGTRALSLRIGVKAALAIAIFAACATIAGGLIGAAGDERSEPRPPTPRLAAHDYWKRGETLWSLHLTARGGTGWRSVKYGRPYYRIDGKDYPCRVSTGCGPVNNEPYDLIACLAIPAFLGDDVELDFPVGPHRIAIVYKKVELTDPDGQSLRCREISSNEIVVNVVDEYPEQYFKAIHTSALEQALNEGLFLTCTDAESEDGKVRLHLDIAPLPCAIAFDVLAEREGEADRRKAGALFFPASEAPCERWYVPEPLKPGEPGTGRWRLVLVPNIDLAKAEPDIRHCYGGEFTTNWAAFMPAEEWGMARGARTGPSGVLPTGYEKACLVRPVHLKQQLVLDLPTGRMVHQDTTDCYLQWTKPAGEQFENTAGLRMKGVSIWCSPSQDTAAGGSRDAEVLWNTASADDLPPFVPGNTDAAFTQLGDPKGPYPLPQCWAFKTLRGDVGVFEILRTTRDRDVVVRYKLLALGDGDVPKVPETSTNGANDSEKPVSPASGGRVSGIVTNAKTGGPIAGAFVAIDHSGDAGGANLGRFREEGIYVTAETGEDGRFVLDNAAFNDAHPFYVTCPDFVRYERQFPLSADVPEFKIDVALKPAARLNIAVVNADGTPYKGPANMRLETADHRVFLPPKEDWPRFHHNDRPSRDGDLFTFGELDGGVFSVEAFATAERVSAYIGRVEGIDLADGETKDVVLQQEVNNSKLVVRIASDPYKNPDQPFIVLLSRHASDLMWTDTYFYHPEDERLGRVMDHALMKLQAGEDGVAVIDNPPPESFSIIVLGVGLYKDFKSMGVFPRGARAEVVSGRDTTVEIPWIEPIGPAHVRAYFLGNSVALEAKDYSCDALCALLTTATEDRVKFTASQPIQNSTVSLGEGLTPIRNVLEALYANQGWIVTEGEGDTLVLEPAGDAGGGPPVAGSAPESTTLQSCAEQLLTGSLGAIVVLDADTGAVLAMASSSLPDVPEASLNKAYQAAYPPGSLFKVPLAIAALEEGAITRDTQFGCNGYFRLETGGRPWRCWRLQYGGHGSTDILKALYSNCDVYFYNVAMKLGVDRIGQWAEKLGLGVPTGIDLPDEAAGLIPSREWKQRIGRENNPDTPAEWEWYDGETVNLSIGQGAMLTTPLQNAVLMAAVVNGGRRVYPYTDPANRRAPSEPLISAETLQTVQEGMRLCVEKEDVPSGTGTRARVPGVTVIGQTGTAQAAARNAIAQYNDEEDIPYELRDHALFIGGVLDREPRIAVSVVIDHGLHGSSAAAPLAGAIVKAFYGVRDEAPAQGNTPKGEGGGVATTTGPSDTAARVLHFPEDQGVGRLIITDPGVFTTADYWWVGSFYDMWERLGIPVAIYEAQGDVYVPPGKDVGLLFEREEGQELKAEDVLQSLAKLEPDDLTFLGIHTSLHGEQMLPITRLTGLKALKLGGVDLTGGALESLGQLTSLERLSLWGGLDDACMAPIGRLASLTAMHLATSKPVSSGAMADLSHLANLQEVYLRGSGFDEAGLAHLAALPNLRRLRLVMENLTAAGLAHLSGIPNLEELNVDEVGSADMLKSISQCSHLRKLVLDTFKDTAGLGYLARLPELESLELAIGSVTDKSFKELGELRHLTSLRFIPAEFYGGSGRGITDTSLESLSAVASLEFLVLYEGRFTDAGLAHIAKLTNLRELFIPSGGTSDSGFTDAGLANLAALEHLETLYLRGEGLTDAGMAHLARLKSLRSLEFSTKPEVTEEGIAMLASIPTLEVLKLGKTTVDLAKYRA